MPNGTEDSSANWTISPQGNEAEAIISKVSDGNVQIIEGVYKMVEYASEYLIFLMLAIAVMNWCEIKNVVKI